MRGRCRLSQADRGERAGGPAVVLGFDGTDHLGPDHPDQTGFGQGSNVMPDCAFGFAHGVSQLFDCRRAFVEQVDDLTSGVFEQCPVLAGLSKRRVSARS